MRRKEKRLLIEFFVVVFVLFVLGWTSVPKFLKAQNVNTPEHFPDPIFRRTVEKFVGVGEGEAITQSMIRSKGGTFECPYTVQSVKGIEFLTAIEVFRCDWTQAEEIDLSKNVCLKEIHCNNNSKLTSLRFPHTDSLCFISCMNCKLASLDVSQNPGLISMHCESNQIAFLDVSKNTNLEELWIDRNALTALNVSTNPKLSLLWAGYNQLTALDVSSNPVLGQLFLGDNRLKELDVSHNPLITNLNCGNNAITSLDLSENVGLTGLICGGNPISILDVSKCTLLDFFNYGQIEAVYVSQKAPLTRVYGAPKPKVISGESNE